MKLIFSYLIFPGFLFTACVGMLAYWVDRKLTARIQWRVGPPWYQNFADFAKLLGKEIIVPKSGKALFLFAPLLGLASVSLVAMILGGAIINPLQSFLGDIIVVVYLLILPALAVIIGASSSANPLASVGASREIKLILGYELPFILAIAVAVIKSGGAIRINAILDSQVAGSVCFSISGALAFLIAIIAMQAKLGLVPFDMAEAEQEIMAGPYIEYSGTPLAVFKLTRQMLLVVLPTFLIILFWGYNLTLGWMIFKYAVLLLVVVLIRNTNPRLRIEQATKLFWGPLTAIGLVAVLLALKGL